MKDFILDRLNIMMDQYKNDPVRVNSDYNKEREALKDYHGRELLELLQNADDELRDDMKKEILISFSNDVLSISNNGNPFDEDGILSLMYSNNSGKRKRKRTVIGNKGTGFRSILGWADDISIDSGDLHVRFSDSHAQETLKSIFADENVIKGKKAATLVFPEIVEDYTENEYTTVISIKIKDDDMIRDDIVNQVHGLNEELLLFLNKAESLVIDLGNEIIKYTKEDTNENSILLKKYVDEEVVYEKEWFLNKSEGYIEQSGEKSYYSVIVAYDCDGTNPSNQVIFSYFPTDVYFPYPVLLHSNFELNADRNHLEKGSKTNETILKSAAELLVDTSLKIHKGKTDFEALKFLIKQERLQAELVSYDFENMLISAIKKVKIFPTVNKKLVSFSDELSYYETSLAKYLSGKGFENLLMSTADKDVLEYLNRLGIDTWDDKTSADKINSWIERHKATEEHMRRCAYTAFAYMKEYDYKRNYYIPNFFFNHEGKIVTGTQNIFYFREDLKVSKLPNFIKIEFLHPYMKNYIANNLAKEYGSEENVLKKLEAYYVIEYNSERLLTYLNEIIDQQDSVTQKNNYWKKIIKWIYENRNTLLADSDEVNIYLRTRSKELIYSNELYAGIEYSNALCEKLVGKINPRNMLCNLKEFLGEVDENELLLFINKLGVRNLPKIVKKAEFIINYRAERNRYAYKVFEQLHYPYKLAESVFGDIEDIYNRYSRISFDKDYIDGLEEILNECNTEDILEWIRCDDKLHQILKSHESPFSGNIGLVWDNKQSPRSLDEIKRPYSYIYYMFETIPWIQVGANRYKIEDCLVGLDKNVDLSPWLVEPDISEYIKNVKGSKAKVRKEYEDILANLNVSTDFCDLSVEKIYSVLAYLPKVNGSENVAKRFYISLINNGRSLSKRELEKSTQYKEFLNNGKVICNTGYKTVSEVFYLNGKDVCNTIAANYNLISLPKRLNNGRVELLLGVKKLVLTGDIEGTPIVHPDNKLFVNDFKRFLPLAFVYRIDAKEDVKTEARKFGAIDITICSKISAKYNDMVVELDDYEFILKGAHSYYLKVPQHLSMNHNIQLSSAVANIISSYLEVNEVMQKVRELYYAGTNKEREFLLLQEFEDESYIIRAKQMLRFDDELKDEFIDIISRIAKKNLNDYQELIDNIDFEHFSEISNANAFIELFKALNIDVCDYNDETPSIEIDLCPYFNGEVTRALPLYEQKYKLTHYERLKEKTADEQQELVSYFISFENNKVIVKNSIFFDCKKEIIKQLEINDSVEVIDLVSIYEKGKKQLKCKRYYKS